MARNILSKYQEPITPERVILVVDDAREYLRIFQHMLEQYYDLAMAKSALDALRVLQERLVDLILLDIEMPGMSGLALFNSLKTNPLYRTIPVIFVSSHKQSQIIATAGKLGARGYIIKPFTEELLLSRVNPILKNSSGKMAAIDLTMKLVRVENSLMEKGHDEGKAKNKIDEKYWSFESRYGEAIRVMDGIINEKDKYIIRVKMELERIYIPIKNQDVRQALAGVRKLIDDLGVRALAEPTVEPSAQPMDPSTELLVQSAELLAQSAALPEEEPSAMPSAALPESGEDPPETITNH
jgi:CheY-like chemotaxis protein